MTDRCDVPHFDNSIQPTTPVLTAYSHAHYDTAKRAVYTSLILSTLLYGCECWALTERLLHRLRVFHAQCVRAMCRVTRKHVWEHHITTGELCARLGLDLGPPL